MKTLTALTAISLFAGTFHAQAQTTWVPPKPPTIDEVIANMNPDIKNEAIPLGQYYDWKQHPKVVQYTPHGSALLPLTWWKGIKPEWCSSILSWYTAFEYGTSNHQALNTRLQLRNLEIWILHEHTKQWMLIDHVETPNSSVWHDDGYVDIADPFKPKPETVGLGHSVKFDHPHFYHGYGTPKYLDKQAHLQLPARAVPRPWEVRAVYVQMDFRLVLDNPSGTDDRNQAFYVVNVGADYYPGYNQAWGERFAPGVGTGKYLKATKDWRTATMLVPNTSTKEGDRVRTPTTWDELRNNPPPPLKVK